MSELYAPLKKSQSTKEKSFALSWFFKGLIFLPFLYALILYLFTPQPPALEPYAIAPFPQDIVRAAPPPPETAAKVPTISIIDGMTGRSQQVPLPQTLQDTQAPANPLKIPLNNAPSTQNIQESKPLEAYSANFRPTLRQAALPRIAIIVSGKDLPNIYEKLPPATTVALPALLNEAQTLAEKIRGRGLELLLQLPPEHLGADAKPLKAGALPKQLNDNFAAHLASFTSYIGVFLPSSAKLTAHEGSLTTILRETGQRGLLFIEDGSGQESLTLNLGKSLQTPALRVDVILESGGTLSQRFTDLEAIAKREGAAIGYLSAAQAAQLSAWARMAESRGFLFAPISALLTRKGF